MEEVNTLYQDLEGRNYCADCGSHYVTSPEEAEAYEKMYEALKLVTKNCYKDKRGAYWIGRVSMEGIEQALASASGELLQLGGGINA